MSNQSLLQQTVRDLTATAHTYEGDWHALFTADGIGAGTFNERMLAWINFKLTASHASLPGAMHAFAVANGANEWNGLTTFS